MSDHLKGNNFPVKHSKPWEDVQFKKIEYNDHIFIKYFMKQFDHERMMQ